MSKANIYLNAKTKLSSSNVMYNFLFNEANDLDTHRESVLRISFCREILNLGFLCFICFKNKLTSTSAGSSMYYKYCAYTCSPLRVFRNRCVARLHSW